MNMLLIQAPFLLLILRVSIGLIGKHSMEGHLLGLRNRDKNPESEQNQGTITPRKSNNCELLPHPGNGVDHVKPHMSEKRYYY